jgi:hypothetical protein
VQVEGKPAKRVTSDSSGAFRAGGLEEGRISVRLDARDQGYVPTEWLDVAAGARDVRLLATPGESISGFVRDAEGRPARQVSLSAIDASGNAAGQTWVWDEEGAFELRGLRPGTYTLRAELRVEGGRRRVTQEVAGVLTGARDVEIRLR